MIRVDSLIGFLGFDAVKAERSWSEDTISLLRIVGNIFVNGLERKRAEEALTKSEEASKRLAEENAIIAEIGRIISSTLNIEEVYDRFAEEVQKIIPSDRIAINVTDPGRHTVTIAYSSGVEIQERSPGDVIPITGTLSGEVICSKSGLIIDAQNPDEIAGRFPGLLPSFSCGLRSLMAVPLISKDQVLGTLHFRSKEANPYSEKDLELAQKVGNQIAGALANALLFAEQKRTEECVERERGQIQGSVRPCAAGVPRV